MPSRSELLQQIRQIDPRTKELPDDVLAGALAEKYPQYAESLKKPESGFDRIQQLQAKAPKGEVARKARTHLTNIGMAQSAATQEQETRNAYARAAGQAAEMLPFAAIAPMTAGTSLAGGMALMGAAGLAGGLARENVKAAIGSSEIPQTVKQVAKTLGVDALTGSLAEVGGRVTGKIFTSLIPRLVVRSGARDQLGDTALTQLFDQARRRISTVSQNHVVDTTNSYLSFFDEMSTLPKGFDKLGKRLTQFSEKAQGIFSDVQNDLGLSQGGIGSTKQPLDALVTMRGRLNQIAWDKTAVTPEEAAALQRFADRLDTDIRAGLKATSGKEGEALYNQANAIWKIQKRKQLGTLVVEDALKRMSQRATYAGAVGAAGGGYSGYRRGGISGAVKGGLEGAAIGATAGLISGAPPKISAWVLDYVSHHPEAQKTLSEAVEFYASGETGKAAALASRAITLAGIRDHIKEAIRHPEVIAPTVPPQ